MLCYDLDFFFQYSVLKPFPNFQDRWKERLRHKFQNSRKKTDNNLPEVKANKRLKTETTAKMIQGRSTWGDEKFYARKTRI